MTINYKWTAKIYRYRKSVVTAVRQCFGCVSIEFHVYNSLGFQLFFHLPLPGPSIGTIISFPLSAVLCQYGFDGGWPSVFYIFGKFWDTTTLLQLLLVVACINRVNFISHRAIPTGTVGIIWFILWILTTADSPSTHPRISPEEREYIESHLPPPKQQVGTSYWLMLFFLLYVLLSLILLQNVHIINNLHS